MSNHTGTPSTDCVMRTRYAAAAILEVIEVTARQRNRAASRRRPRGLAALLARQVAIGVGIALTLSACSGGGAASGERSTSLTVAFPQEPANWDYVKSPATAIKALLMHNVVEPLVEKKQDGSLKPLLAESFEVSDDGLEYEFTIRKATFHDGSDLSADDVVYSLKHTSKSPNGDVSAPFQAVETIEKTDDRTVRVTLSRPSQLFAQGMSGISGVIIPEGTGGKLAKGPVGTGPYVFGKWRNGIDVTLSRFDDYWGKKPFFNKVRWRYFKDETASLNALLAGDVDLVSNIIGDGLNRLDSVDKQEGFAKATTAGSEMMYLSLNAKDKIFADKRVRQAIAHAIDRQAIIDGAIAGLGKPNCTFVNPPTEPWNSDYCPYPYDPDRARQLLADAGAKDLRVTFKYLKSGYFEPAKEVIAAQLGKVGIEVDTASRDLATYLDEVLGSTPDYQFTNLSGPQQIDSWKCPGWFTGDCVKQADELLASADKALDRKDWADMRRKAVELHADRAYLIPIGNLDEVSALHDDLAGFKPYRSASELDLRSLHWKER